MATKAVAARKCTLFIGTTSDATVTPFSAVRNWTVRVERQVIEATSNDSSGWRELVTATNPRDAGQRTALFSAEAIYDISTGGPNDNQPAQRKGIMGALIGSGRINYIEMRLGRDPTSTSGSGWAHLLKNASTAGLVESVSVGGTYNGPVLFDVVIRVQGSLSGI